MIREVADQLLERHWDRRIPVDIQALAERVGARIEVRPRAPGDADWCGNLLYRPDLRKFRPVGNGMGRFPAPGSSLQGDPDPKEGFGNRSPLLVPELAGAPGPGQKTVPVLQIPEEDSVLRQRFAVAHTLGHHLLGHGRAWPGFDFRDPPAHYGLKAGAWWEEQANQFAMRVLIPDLAIRYFLKKEGLTDPRAMASKLQVSPVAMVSRLRETGWLRSRPSRFRSAIGRL